MSSKKDRKGPTCVLTLGLVNDSLMLCPCILCTHLLFQGSTDVSLPKEVDDAQAGRLDSPLPIDGHIFTLGCHFHQPAPLQAVYNPSSTVDDHSCSVILFHFTNTEPDLLHCPIPA